MSAGLSHLVPRTFVGYRAFAQICEESSGYKRLISTDLCVAKIGEELRTMYADEVNRKPAPRLPPVLAHYAIDVDGLTPQERLRV